MSHKYRDKSSFGTLLAEYRKELGWTQPELARQLTRRGYPVSGSTINKYELGQRTPQGDFLFTFVRCYASCLEISPEDEHIIVQGLARALAAVYHGQLIAEVRAARDEYRARRKEKRS